MLNSVEYKKKFYNLGTWSGRKQTLISKPNLLSTV